MKRAILAIISTVVAVVGVVRYDVPSAATAVDDSQVSMPEAAILIEDVPETTTSTSTTTVLEQSVDDTVAPSTTTTTTSTTTTTVPQRQTLVGPSAPTAYGPVQVRAVVQDGKLLSVSTPVFPKTTAMSAKLNQEAVVKLQTKAVNAQSADLDVISGATETSTGFINSLKGALAKL